MTVDSHYRAICWAFFGFSFLTFQTNFSQFNSSDHIDWIGCCPSIDSLVNKYYSQCWKHVTFYSAPIVCVNQTFTTWPNKTKTKTLLIEFYQKKIKKNSLIFLFVWKSLSIHSSFLNAIKLLDYAIGLQKISKTTTKASIVRMNKHWKT